MIRPPLLAGCILTTLLLAVAARGDEVDDVVQQQMRNQRIPGLALAVVKDGKVIKTAGYGYADAENKSPVTPDTVFQIQSMTKQFTATAIMMLVEEGKVGLDDPISRHLEGTPAAWKDVTIRRLLTHTSGIKDFINEPTQSLRLDVTEEQVLATTATRPLNFKPGADWAYSNTNYHLLAMIIRRHTGEWYGDVLRERIFEPLGMSRTAVFREDAIVPNRALGYLLDDMHLRPGLFIAPSVLSYGGGGICSTAQDLARWDAALGTEKLLKRGSLEQMWTPVTLTNATTRPYGFGWTFGEYHGHHLVDHGGGNTTGFGSMIQRWVDDKLTVVVLTNLYGSNVERIAWQVAGKYVPEIAPPLYKPIEDKEPAVTQRVREIIERIAAGTITADDFTPTLWMLISGQKDQIKGILAELGPLQTLTLVEHSRENGLSSYRYRAAFKDGTTHLVHIAFDAKNKVALIAPEPD